MTPSSAPPSEPPPDPGRASGHGAGAWLAALVGTLAVANVIRSTVVPDGWHFWFNLAIGAAAGLVALGAGLDRVDLGLDPRLARDGLRVGAGAFAVASVVIIIGGLTGVVSDDRTDVNVQQMLIRTLVTIPLATVLVEELAFRGVMHALMRRVWPPALATAVGAALFGLWHVLPTWQTGSAGDVEVSRLAAAAGTFAATTAAGVVFTWLRERSGSLLSPALLHLATNSVTFAVVWAAA
ncbi:MAG: CPBP family intramembrane metalloprotease [Acidimicrobiales bacterium]|nr:CPBP family intramembrane metalloprotease [Acidimicrobiales bacterium]